MIKQDISSFLNKPALKILAKPNSPKTEILGFDRQKQAIRVNVHAPPEENKANMEILRFFRKLLKKEVALVSGFKSREKIIKIS